MEVNLVFIKKDGTTQSFKLPTAVTFIGRRQDCDLCIPLSVVSRRHCEIYSEFGKVSVRDLKSCNGTRLNDEPIEEAQVKAGDVLDIGPVRFVFQINGVPENFDEFIPTSDQSTAKPKIAAPNQDETQEADLDNIINGLDNISAGQSQTMELDDAFNNNFLDDDDFDLNSELR